MTDAPGTLVLGWGNPGRLDDGLGPALVSAIETERFPGVVADSEYQLQVEHAEAVARYRRVLFVDADRSGCEPFSLKRLQPGESRLSFSTHSISPESVLALARDLFDGAPEAWLLGIRGYDFDEFGESLSEMGRANLAAAVEFVGNALRHDRFEEIGPRMAAQGLFHDSRG